MWHKPANPAETAVIEAVTNAVVIHLRDSTQDFERLNSDSDAHDAAERQRPNGLPEFGGGSVDDADATAGDEGPVLIQVDGPGRTTFLRKLGETLDPTWTRTSLRGRQAGRGGRDRPAHGRRPRAASDWVAISFDAWRHQRVAPPWWWLMSALDTQIRACLRRTGWRYWALQRAEDYVGRAVRLGRDLLFVVPGALFLLVGWQLSQQDMLPFLTGLTTVGGSILALLALASTIGNALRRHLLARSPRGASALLRSTDPMAELLRRYRFLVRSARRPIVVLIDNLDRCRADYVVEMLEGIQTLLRDPLAEAPRSRWTRRWPIGRDRGWRRAPRPFVAFVVAADREWLCESYLHVYEEFKSSINEPGRPFGLLFVDKVFDVALRIPTVAPSMAPWTSAESENRAGAGQTGPAKNPFADLDAELAIRRRLCELQRHCEDDWAMLELRRQAVESLAKIEVSGDRRRRQCGDTRLHLDDVLAQLNPGAGVQRQLDVAYCVKRTTQLLAGHEIDDDADAIRRLALWTIIELKWPLLASHLSREPNDVRALGTLPGGLESDTNLKAVFTDPLAQRVAAGVQAADDRVTLTPEDVARFTVPASARPPAASRTPTRFRRSATAPSP